LIDSETILYWKRRDIHVKVYKNYSIIDVCQYTQCCACQEKGSVAIVWPAIIY